MEEEQTAALDMQDGEWRTTGETGGRRRGRASPEVRRVSTEGGGRKGWAQKTSREEIEGVEDLSRKS
jgi:hypothetical protein